jgi:hypothetical protein
VRKVPSRIELRFDWAKKVTKLTGEPAYFDGYDGTKNGFGK